jgi:hypothetical protein
MGKLFKSLALKTALLRIWFMKNLTLFLKLGMYIVIILILTGRIDASTPVLGGIFGDLSQNIRDIINSDYDSNTLINLGTVIMTFLVTLGTLSNNLKRIGLNDIKSNELKKALVTAGLYFNREGKLVKRVEELARIDITGDGKLGDSGVSIDDIPEEKFIDGLKRAGDEFKTIMTLEIEEDHELGHAVENSNILDNTLETVEDVVDYEENNLKGIKIDIDIKPREGYEDYEDPSLFGKIIKKTSELFMIVYQGLARAFNFMVDKIMGYEYEEVPIEHVRESLFEPEVVEEPVVEVDSMAGADTGVQEEVPVEEELVEETVEETTEEVVEETVTTPEPAQPADRLTALKNRYRR